MSYNLCLLQKTQELMYICFSLLTSLNLFIFSFFLIQLSDKFLTQSLLPPSREVVHVYYCTHFETFINYSCIMFF